MKDYNPKQQEFPDFVLKQYVKEEIDELDDTKISDLLILKYHAIADAKKNLGISLISGIHLSAFNFI